jgi:23S rRNA pseudouridine1911/1915/1917 synthase
MPTWIVSFPDRLDAFLSKEERMPSRQKAQAAIERGSVTVNDEVVTKPAHRVQEGDKVECTEDERYKMQDATTEHIDMHLTVLYEDNACMVINKPAGVAVHPGAGMAAGEKTLLHGIAWMFHERSLPYRSDAVLVHRLDRETTGCILIAKTPEAHQELQRQFEERTVRKIYLAIVAGLPNPPSAVIDAPVGRSTANRTKMAVLGSSASREARTTYRTLGKGGNASLLLCEIHTGRTHQIRLHLATIGHPILGDGTYHNELSDRAAQEHAVANLCLHAWKLTFRSPVDGESHSVEAPIPSTFSKTLETLGLHPPPPTGGD